MTIPPLDLKQGHVVRPPQWKVPALQWMYLTAGNSVKKRSIYWGESICNLVPDPGSRLHPSPDVDPVQHHEARPREPGPGRCSATSHPALPGGRNHPVQDAGAIRSTRPPLVRMYTSPSRSSPKETTFPRLVNRSCRSAAVSPSSRKERIHPPQKSL